MNIYVGNLAYSVTVDDLRDAFGKFGKIDSVAIIVDKLSGQSKGFGFVEMLNDVEGQSAIDGTNGAELNGRAMKVNEAKPRDESGRPPERRQPRQ